MGSTTDCEIEHFEVVDHSLYIGDAEWSSSSPLSLVDRRFYLCDL